MAKKRTRTSKTFAALLREVQQHGRRDGEAQVSIVELARRCGVARSYLYDLMLGTKTTSEWLVERIAKGLSVPVRVVRATLAQSRDRVVP